MKFLLSSSLLISLASLLPSTVHSFGYMDTCGDQAKCLLVTVSEIRNECETGSCEYEVCWRQLTGGTNGCWKYGDVEYLGDMHRYRDKTIHEGGCVNEENEDGKGYWDNECQDPNHVYTSGSGWYTFFNKVCQIVSPGHTAHLLIYDGDSCSVMSVTEEPLEAEITSYNVELPVTCRPSTQNLDGSNPGGQTFFPDPNDPAGGGTCSAKPEGEECVWSVTVPDHCSFEETGCQVLGTGENLNSDDLCPGDFDVLEYYENDQNGPPAKPVIHDIALNGDGTVSFRVQSPYEGEFHDLYTVYPKPGAHDNWNYKCHKEQAASECTSDEVLTAQCLHSDQKFTLVTVFVAGYTDDSSAAQNIHATLAGNAIFECCPTDNEPINQTQESHVSAFTYLVYCECELGDVNRARLLRTNPANALEGSANDNSISLAFHNGDLFDDQLKELYGLN